MRKEYETNLFGHLLPNHFKASNVISNIQIESFDFFLQHRLQKIIEEDCVLLARVDKHQSTRVTFGQVYVDYPYIIDNKRNIKYITPHEARVRELTYSSCLSVDVHVETIVDGKTIHSSDFPKVLLARIPMMIRSTKCNLNRPSSRLVSASSSHAWELDGDDDDGECRHDPGGYFIIRGKERVLIAQERGNLNHVYVFRQKDACKYNYIAELRAMSEENGHSVLVHMRLYPDTYRTTFFASFFHQDVDMAHIFKYYECTPDEIMAYFSDLSSKHSMIKLYVHTLSQYVGSLDTETATAYLCDNLVHSMTKEMKESYLEKIMTNDIFLNLGITSTPVQKKMFLLFMLKRLLMTASGELCEDDRDHLNNKRFETAGYLVSELFRALYKRFLRLMEPQLQKKQDVVSVMNRTNIITQGIKACFSTGNWGIPKSNYIRCGVSQILSRLSYNATLSHLRRILIPVGKEGKNSKIRQIHNSQFGYICANECFDPSTLIRLFDGEIVLAKDIVVGDVLVDEKHRPTRVRTLVRGRTCMYDVTPREQEKGFMRHRVTWNHILTVLVYHDKEHNEKGYVIRDLRLWEYNQLDEASKERMYLFKKPGVATIVTSRFDTHAVGLGPFVGWRLVGTGRFCLADWTVTHNTPEGGSAGIVKSFSLFASVTNKVDVCLIRNIMEEWFGDVFVHHSTTPEKDCTIFLNGMWVGFTADPLAFVETFRMYRDDRCMIPKSVSVTFQSIERAVYVYSDDGRIIRPLWNLTAFRPEHIMDVISRPDVQWRALCECNMIRYLDCHESEQEYIAMYIDEATPQHTYCEIHPSFIFGVCVNLIPYVDHIQAPRITYQSAMSKQAIGLFCSNPSARCDTVAHVLCSPEQPVVQTHLSELLKYDKMASGVNAIVAIACYGGFNQEDSVIINKASLDRGLFRSFTFRTIMTDEKKKSSYSSEVIELPPEGVRNKLYHYDKLNSRGIVRVGMYVGANDVLVGKTIRNCKKGGGDGVVDNSVIVRNGEEGYIDSVFESVNPDGYLTIKIKLRTLKIPEMGDKFACYHPDTDVLTDHGWVRIADVSLSHKIACLGDDGHLLVYRNPTDLQSYDYRGDMYTIQSPGVELCVTPNHRMYTSRDFMDYEVSTAEDICGEPREYMVNVEVWEPEDPLPEDFVIRGDQDHLPDIHIPRGIWCALLGMWYAGGKGGGGWGPCLSVVRLWYTIVGLDYPDKRVERCLQEDCPRDRLPEWCKRMTREQSRSFLRPIIRSLTGRRHGSMKRVRFTTNSAPLRDDVQHACLHAGYRSVCEDYGKDDKYVVKIYYHHDANHPGPIVDWRCESWVAYNGPVYCCTVPTKHGVIMVRRNGRPVWCGNSRSAQKGIIGVILNQEDMPFTPEGIIPDIIINPHSQPSRMTINQLMECVAAKSAVIRGEYVYSTPFSTHSQGVVETLTDRLHEVGYQRYGNEFMINGITGQPFATEIFIGPTYYQRLKHLVSNKLHARDHGSVQTLVRQPLEGRSRDGGLRFGEMERDCMISHGVSKFLNERLFDLSDKFEIPVCTRCGHMASRLDECSCCGDQTPSSTTTSSSSLNRDTISYLAIPYACKLLFQELMAMMIKICFHVKKN